MYIMFLTPLVGKENSEVHDMVLCEVVKSTINDLTGKWLSSRKYATTRLPKARALLTQAMKDGNFDKFIDSRLPRDYNDSEMVRMKSCAQVYMLSAWQKQMKRKEAMCCRRGLSFLVGISAILSYMLLWILAILLNQMARSNSWTRSPR
ncbi:hypothetical protein Tco_0500336 [Tanacetum coccineum]